MGAGQRAGWASGSLGGVLRGGVGDSSFFPLPGLAWPSPTLSPEPVSRQRGGCRDGSGGERAINREGRKQK